MRRQFWRLNFPVMGTSDALWIISADPGWVAKFVLTDGSLVRMRIAFWVVKDDGTFDSVAPSLDGELELDGGMHNFVGYEWIGGT